MVVIVVGNEEGTSLAVERNAIAVIVDVLRASTTIPVAIAKGLDELWAVKEVEECYNLQKIVGGFIMGERNCQKLPGFKYGNSPVEIDSEEKLPDKKAVFTSTTGAKRMLEASKGARYLIIGSIINASAVAERIKEIIAIEKAEMPTVIIPAYTEGTIVTLAESNNSLATEDQIGGVLIARECKKKRLKINNETLQEITALEKQLEKKSIEELLRATTHGKKLLKMGFEKDILFCSKLNSCSVVPEEDKQRGNNIQTKIPAVCLRRVN